MSTALSNPAPRADPAVKGAENQKKHGVSFSRAQYAFADPQRVIAMDEAHSKAEERF
jgi:uncharacterized protein